MQLKWGAHAHARAVLRGLAEHTGLLLWPNRLVSRKSRNRRAGAPVGTREGACAPQKEVNRSGLGKVGLSQWLVKLDAVAGVRSEGGVFQGVQGATVLHC